MIKRPGVRLTIFKDPGFLLDYRGGTIIGRASLLSSTLFFVLLKPIGGPQIIVVSRAGERDKRNAVSCQPEKTQLVKSNDFDYYVFLPCFLDIF
jgi:hypothetical protein